MSDDGSRPQMTVVSRRIIKWDGEEPEGWEFLIDPSRHPKCLEVWQKDGDDPPRKVYERKQIWL